MAARARKGSRLLAMIVSLPRGKFYCNQAHRIAYLPIRKCACTSIAYQIAGLKTKHVRMPLWDPQNEKVNFDLVTADEQDLQDFFTFTLVRNPYGRFLSFYQNWVVNPPHHGILAHYEKFGLTKNMTFEDCVKTFTKIPDFSFLEGHTAPMYLYVLRHQTIRVKFIGRFENIANDMQYVRSACGMTGELPLLNRTPLSPEDRDPYTPKLRGLIYAFYRLDFDLFGYDKLDATLDVSEQGRLKDMSAEHCPSFVFTELQQTRAALEAIYGSRSYRVARVLSKLSEKVLRPLVGAISRRMLKAPWKRDPNKAGGSDAQ